MLARHVDALSRTARPAHLTASTLVIDPGAHGVAPRVLLTLHPKVGRWLQLGGHCEAHDATLRSAAAREALEESGIGGLLIDEQPAALDRHAVRCGTDTAIHLDVQYLATAPSGSTAVISAESTDLAWFALDELPGDCDPAVQRLVTLAAARLL